ncbi:hypothetical protein C8R45DRAFT_909556 [Mycena sanguinolenta]|nr:hypothetical protein C8R45DRAFT_909556 [Mycena sanguinolenta]
MSFAPLTRPATSQVKVDQTQNLPQSDGFTWPTFRLLNKQARVTLSPDFLVPSNVRKVLTIASVHGLFAATTSKGLIISSLSELREAFKSGTDSVFTPKRTLPCNPVCISFACNDTRLLAGTETGQILVFDTAQLSSSSSQVDPIHVFQGSSSPASQILPNPSNENDLAQFVAILRVDGTVQILDMQMESKGAWAGTDFESTLVAASWSPKGKQLAVGLRSGDIFTLGLTNNNLPLKQIPPTSNSPLASLQWVGPAHTFRTSYGANPLDPPHHIVSLDSRSNTAAFVQLTHPFPLADRAQNAQVLVLPRWDQDAATVSAEETKALIVVGDTSSTDLEVLGNAGSRWFQQSQENPLTVPLDKNDDDTFLLTLDVDLSDELPIMYAYLNDGTVQGWYITHSDSKPYVGLLKGAQTSPSAPAFGQQASGSAFGQQQPSTQSTSPFPQPTPPTTAFGQSSGFGQSTTSAFGQAQSQPPFGQAQATSAFGQTGFGQPAFGQSSFGAQAPSAFGSSNNTSSGFGAFAGTPNAFSSLAAAAPPAAPPPLSSTPSVSMGDAAPSFGGLSLGGSSSESDNKNKAVGGGMFGSGPPPLPLPPNHPANQPSNPSPSNFSDSALIKPAGGFGAFGALSSGAFGNPKPLSSFGSGGGAFGGSAFSGSSGSSASDAKPATIASPAFGSTGFGFGQSSFGQKPASVFGQSSFGTPGAASASTGGGFSAFASTGPTGFGNASSSAFGGGGNTATSPSGATTSTGGFSTFASQGPSAFGTPSPFGGNASGASPSAPVSVFGGGASTPSTPASNPVASAFSGFGTPKDSLFGNKTPAAQLESASSSPEPAKDLNSPSPGDSPPPAAPSSLKFTVSNPTTTGGAFGNLKSASTGFLKPASGFGAFGSDTTPTSSPFFNAASQAPKTPPVSAFGNLGSTPPTTPKPAAGGSPAFGATSQLGGFKSSFPPVSSPATPTTTPTATSGGFSAFSAPVSLSSSTTQVKSFGDLLKTTDDSQEKPKPVSVFGGSGLSTLSKQESSSPSPSPAPTAPAKPAPVFTPPPKDTKDKTAEASSPNDGKGTSESSFGGLSQSSSFVEISGGDAEGDADGEPADDGEPGDDDDGESFLSESFGSGSEAPPDEDDGEDDSRSPSPSAVPLPPSRSPSSTPRAEVPPKINVAPTPEEDEEEDEGESDSSEGRLSTIREESTTPPGSPEKNPSPPAKTPLVAPVPVAPSPFGLGLGRPSTRPTRSSPLANAPVSGDEDAKEETPAALKPRPASPKPPFGSFTPPVKTESIAENDGPAAKPVRPKTPPLSALSFGFGSSAPKAPLNAGKIPLAGAPLPTLPTASPAPPISPGSASPTSAGGFFGFGTPKSTVSPTVFPGIQPTMSFPKPTPTPVAPPPEATMEEGMQKECALLFANMTRGLEDFRSLAQAANQRRLELSRSAGSSRRASDLGNRTKWSLADAAQFGQTLRQYEQDLADMKEERSQWEKSVRELQSNLLKAGTRREEIGRFLKAQHDNDFAKMLKSRTLGPEHLETQTHLRRSIRAMQDRIQKLESHLQESKKRLSRANSGNPGLRAPTLDTLNRTFRNMDIALDNQTSDVQRLTARIAKLNMKDSQRTGHAASTRDARLPDPVTRQRPFNVTPHVAMTTAAALNAERSAHKLKRALLSVRKEPLLNTQAASAPPAPLAFNTPQKPGLGLGLRGIPSTPPQSTMPGFDFPEDTFNPSPPPAVRRGAGGGGKTRISQSVPLKRGPAGYSTPSPPPTFDWGPLPTFQKPAPVSPGNSLSGSWVADGFGSNK